MRRQEVALVADCDILKEATWLVAVTLFLTLVSAGLSRSTLVQGVRAQAVGLALARTGQTARALARAVRLPPVFAATGIALLLRVRRQREQLARALAVLRR